MTATQKRKFIDQHNPLVVVDGKNRGRSSISSEGCVRQSWGNQCNLATGTFSNNDHPVLTATASVTVTMKEKHLKKKTN